MSIAIIRNRVGGDGGDKFQQFTGFLKDTTSAYATYNGVTYSWSSSDYGFIIPNVLTARYQDGYKWQLVFNFDGLLTWSNGNVNRIEKGIAIVKTMPSNGLQFTATPQEAKFPVIYDHGSWSVAYDNPGSWYTGWTNNAATLNATNFVLTGTVSPSRGALLGSANELDLSNYSLLKVKVHVTGSDFGWGIWSQKNVAVAYRLAYNTIPANSAETEYAIDISNVNAGYFCILCGDGANRTATVTKIWLE